MADWLAARSECPSCGGRRRDDGGKALTYHHRDDCAEVLRHTAIFSAFIPAAPAAEGPRAEASGINCSECETDDDVPCLCNAAAAEGPQDEIAPRLADDPRRFIPDVAKARAIVAARQAAALPGAEAGTPDERFDQLLHDLLHAYAKLHTLPFIAEEDASDAGAAVTLALQKVKRLFGEVTRSLRAESTELSDRLADLTARHNELRVAMIGAADEAAALTSEVRALREENDTMLRELVAMLPGSRWADVLAPRLASPSPTGAP